MSDENKSYAIWLGAALCALLLILITARGCDTERENTKREAIKAGYVEKPNVNGVYHWDKP